MSSTNDSNLTWIAACRIADMPFNGGACVKYKNDQIALFYFARRQEWYAIQNKCPHRQQMALSRGMIGTQEGEPKVACPFHKKTFSLVDGRCMNDEDCGSIKTYPVKVENTIVFIGVEENESEAEMTRDTKTASRG